MEPNYLGTRWTSKTEYYDIETGEQITETQFKRHYIKHKTNKYAELNHNKTKGHIRYTIEARRKPQLKLFND